jgi:5-methylthioadenosine/S-adenosylhomocysteine deaminase
LAEFDLLQPTLSVVHGLELSIEQAEQLANSGVSLITCPRSNQFLHKKMVNELLLWHPTLSIAIGTDAHVSLPNPTVLDMRLELQALKLAYPWLTWEALLVMATLNGAKALGLAGQVGELTEGTWADIAVWQVPQQLEELSLEALLESVLNSDQKPIQVIVGGL